MKQEESTDIDRVEELMKILKKSKNALGVAIGDKNGMRFQHVSTGRNKISAQLAADVVAAFPQISYEWFFNGAGEPIQEVKYVSQASKIEVSEPKEQMPNKAGNVIEEKGNGKWKIWTKKLPVKAFASYLSEFRNANFLEELDDVSWTVDHYPKGRYITIEAEGDSMNGGHIDDTADGAEMLCRELLRHHWRDGFRDSRLGWVIVHRETMVFKDIIKYDSKTGDIVCHSRSGLPQHPDFTINLNDILEIWKVIKRAQ